MNKREAGLPEYMKFVAMSIHPPDEDWVEYHKGRVTAAERTRMEEHLTGCAVCRTVLEDVYAFLAPEPALSEGAARPVMTGELAKAVRPPRPARPAFQWAMPMAAALALGLGGLAWHATNDAGRMREEVARSSRELASAREDLNRARVDAGRLRVLSQPNPIVMSLFPAGAAVRSAGGADWGAAAIGSGRQVLFALSELRAGGPFRIELRSAATPGTVLEAWDGVTRTADGDVKLMLGPLAPGTYDFVIAAAGVSYRFRVK